MVLLKQRSIFRDIDTTSPANIAVPGVQSPECFCGEWVQSPTWRRHISGPARNAGSKRDGHHVVDQHIDGNQSSPIQSAKAKVDGTTDMTNCSGVGA